MKVEMKLECASVSNVPWAQQ